MKKEVLAVFLVVLLGLVPFSSAQLSSIEINDVNVNESQLQILVENQIDKNFNKITFIINSQYTIIQDETLNAFETKFFVVNYPGGIKLGTVKVIVGDQSDDYVFTGNEDTFVVNQEVSSSVSTTESNSPISYIYSAGRVAKIQDGNIIYFSSDNVGSTSLETGSSGEISFKANYLPFGKELSFSSINNEKYGFTGKEFDVESSLNYFNARYYNPSSGKFISNDPIFKPTEGGYQYVRNNPLTITDPSGKQAPPDASSITISISSIIDTRYRPHYISQRTEEDDVRVAYTQYAIQKLLYPPPEDPMAPASEGLVFPILGAVAPGCATVVACGLSGFDLGNIISDKKITTNEIVPIAVGVGSILIVLLFGKRLGGERDIHYPSSATQKFNRKGPIVNVNNLKPAPPSVGSIEGVGIKTQASINPQRQFSLLLKTKKYASVTMRTEEGTYSVNYKLSQWSDTGQFVGEPTVIQKLVGRKWVDVTREQLPEILKNPSDEFLRKNLR